ncbi:MAG: hypothetical protein MZW92_19395 [Comamonadaceae bacterium]|nr:hypothetical protein [Comamonadaceae bacterium]
MMALWADDDEIVCVHPGGRAPRRRGGDPRQLRGDASPTARIADASRGRCTGCRRWARAVHHLVERVDGRRPTQGRGELPGCWRPTST